MREKLEKLRQVAIKAITHEDVLVGVDVNKTSFTIELIYDVKPIYVRVSKFFDQSEIEDPDFKNNVKQLQKIILNCVEIKKAAQRGIKSSSPDSKEIVSGVED